MPAVLKQNRAEMPAIFGGSPLFDRLLPIVRPEVPEEAVRNGLCEQFAEILRSGMLSNGRMVRRLEEEAAERVGVRECVVLASCTAGLVLTMRCLELEGEVIVPSFTFFASAHAVMWNGLEPVLVDSERDTFNIDPARVREAITERTSALLGVHIFGNPAAIQELEAIAREHNLKLIFDAAHGLGASVDGRPVGGGGNAEVFSLSPTKLLVAGEGGLVATNDPELARKLRMARNYGDPGDYDCQVLGFNARMTEMQAALALAGLDGVGERVAQRNRIAAAYQARLARQPGITFQRICSGSVSSYKDFGLVIEPEEFSCSRDFLRTALERENIQIRSYFDPPLHRQKLYCERRRYDVQNAEWISRRILSLPIYSSLSPETAEAIADRILMIRDAAAEGAIAWVQHGS